MAARPSVDVPGWLDDRLAQASPDLLRAMLKSFVDALLSADADAVCGAGWGERSPEQPPPTTLPANLSKAARIDARFNQRLPMCLFFIDVKTGEVKEHNHGTNWLNHVQFSPADPTLLMFCHEGPWHKVDRTWTIRSDGSQLTKIHTRTMAMEIEGHEFFGGDGKWIWYDLQTPRGQVFWVAGYEVATGHRVWYNLTRDEWSVHFNVSPDGKWFAGDGGSEGMVARGQGSCASWYPASTTDRSADASQPNLREEAHA